MGLIGELRRRNVFRVGIAYVLIAWVALQAADFALDLVGAPEWVLRAAFALALIGLPVALVFAWIFEMTPEGLKRERDIDRNRSITRETGRKLDRVIISVLVLAVALLLADRFVSPRAPERGVHDAVAANGGAQADSADATRTTPTTETSPDRRSVAALPFDSRSSNPEDQYFAEGVHDDLLTQLAKIGSLKVISRTSVAEYANTTKKIPEIAQELGVATILEGGVQRSGTRVRINAQLIDAATDEHLWAETFDRELTAENLFDIQAEIARAIAGALQATLSPEEQAQLERRLTSSLPAWEAYQRAYRLRNEQAASELVSALREIDLALQYDPGFAAAYALRAILLMQQFWFEEQDPALREAALVAIGEGRKLEPELPELDLAEGFYRYWGFLDYAAALAAFNRVLAVVPNQLLAVQGQAYVMRRMGDLEGAVSMFRRVAELDPRDALNWADMSATLLNLRRFAQAGAMLERAKALAPNNAQVAFYAAVHHWHADRDLARARLAAIRGASDQAEANQVLFDLLVSERNGVAAAAQADSWPEEWLDVRLFWYSRDLLHGLERRYAGDDAAARPRLEAALGELDTLIARDGDDFRFHAARCLAEGALGNREAAIAAAAATRANLFKDRFAVSTPLFILAQGLALAGARDEAFEVIEQLLAPGASVTAFVYETHPAFDGLAEDEGFRALMARYREAEP